MKTFHFLSIIAISSIMAACGGNANTDTNEPSENTELTNENNETVVDHLAIYDFHSEHRCVTCIAIEDQTKEIIHTYFQKEFDAGTITFDLYNCDAEENQDLVEEYGAFGTTLAFTVFKNNEKIDVQDYTNWAFEMVDTEEFEQGMKEKIETALNKIN